MDIITAGEELTEIERKFLIDIPLKWYGKFKVLTADKIKIYQNYLKEEGEENSRVRTIMYNDRGNYKITYKYTTKKFVSDGINKEKEVFLTADQYRDKLKKIDRSKHQISKTRYYLRFDDRKFEFDVFEDRLLGLAILEIELDDIKDKVLVPPYLKVIKEVTNDKYYSNINLASLDSYAQSKPKFPRRID